MTWGWRKILRLRPNDICPLANHISTWDIFHAGFNLSTKFHELVLFGAWNWPYEWYSKYQFFSALPAPNISNNVQDLLELSLPTGKVLPFSVQVVWNSIRSRDELRPWDLSKKSKDGVMFAQLWDLPESVFISS
ncbi:hypothetical protein Tco_1550606 [Tanacetum coccineum]